MISLLIRVSPASIGINPSSLTSEHSGTVISRGAFKSDELLDEVSTEEELSLTTLLEEDSEDISAKELLELSKEAVVLLLPQALTKRATPM